MWRGKAAAPSLLSLASAVSSSEPHPGPSALPCPTCLGAREVAQSRLVRHGLSGLHGCGEVWTGRSGVPTPSAPLSPSSLSQWPLSQPVGLVVCSPEPVFVRQRLCQLLFGPPIHIQASIQSALRLQKCTGPGHCSPVATGIAGGKQTCPQVTPTFCGQSSKGTSMGLGVG